MYLIKKRGKLKTVTKNEFDTGLKQVGWEFVKEVADTNQVLTKEQKKKLALIDMLDFDTLKKLTGSSTNATEDDNSNPKEDNTLESMTNKELQEFLTENNIEFKSSDTKAELLKLAEKVTN